MSVTISDEARLQAEAWAKSYDDETLIHALGGMHQISTFFELFKNVLHKETLEQVSPKVMTLLMTSHSVETFPLVAKLVPDYVQDDLDTRLRRSIAYMFHGMFEPDTRNLMESNMQIYIARLHSKMTV